MARLKNMRYLDARDKFLEYAFHALGEHFQGRRDNLDKYFNSIRTDELKDRFLKISSFYLFLVKQGDWKTGILGSNNTIDYLTNTYKYIAIFSLIESLSGHKFIDFFEHLKSRQTINVFPIQNQSELDKHFEKYKDKYGSIKRCISFFKALSQERQHALVSKLKWRRISKPEIEPKPKLKYFTIDDLAKFLYDLRSKFVHEAKLVLHMVDGTSVGFWRNRFVVCELSINDAMTFFEEGLLIHF